MPCLRSGPCHTATHKTPSPSSDPRRRRLSSEQGPVAPSSLYASSTQLHTRPPCVPPVRCLVPAHHGSYRQLPTACSRPRLFKHHELYSTTCFASSSFQRGTYSAWLSFLPLGCLSLLSLAFLGLCFPTPTVNSHTFLFASL